MSSRIKLLIPQDIVGNNVFVSGTMFSSVNGYIGLYSKHSARHIVPDIVGDIHGHIVADNALQSEWAIIQNIAIPLTR